MILSRLQVDNFKRIKTVNIELGDVTVLVGTNGSGKSSIVQAVHLACCILRQADKVGVNRTTTVGVDELDYLPTDNYKMLGHKTTWGNKEGTASSDVVLSFTDGTSEVQASCRLRSARNAGISITGSVPPQLTSQLRKRQDFFSAYIPGISGIPNKEERKSTRVVMKACSFGDSNIILRNALLLLRLQSPSNIGQIEKWLAPIVGDVKINVDYEDTKDLFISCMVRIDGDERPLELIGTGYLQLIQIFSYILLFAPGILLVDEPDIHLHPTVQEKLVDVLGEIARQRGMRVLITTHSPFIVRGAPPSAKVYWLSAGAIESEDRQQTELLLGWGVFGKNLLLVSEDANTAFLRRLVGQWPELARSVAFIPGTGYKQLLSPAQAGALHSALGGKFKLVVHRDRDALTDQEVDDLKQKYAAEGVTLWMPLGADVEAYFCTSGFISSLLGCSLQEAEGYLELVLAQSAEIRQQFDAQRSAHNAELYKAGGSPTNDEVYALHATRPLGNAKGKYVFGQLKNKIPAGRFSEQRVLAHSLDGSHAVDLRTMLQSVLSGRP